MSNLGKLINFIGIIITYILSYIIPKKRGLYIFGSSDGFSFNGNSKEVFLYYKDKKRCYYISHNKKLKEKVGKEKFIYAQSLKSYIFLLRAEYIFLDSSIKHISFLYALIGKFSIVLLWHGDGFKKIEFENPYFKNKQTSLGRLILKKQYNNIKLGITGNTFNKKTFNKSFLVNSFKVTGLPRNAVFLKENVITDANILNIKKSSFKKIILYVPTWRDSKFGDYLKPFTEKGFKELDTFLKKKEYVFIYKPHPLSKISYKNTENILIIDYVIDTQELLLISDILVTDYSSIYIDFLLTGKPILFYTYDYDNYIKNDKDLYLSYHDILIESSNFSKESDLILYIDRIDDIVKTEEYITKYNHLKDFFHQYDKSNILKNFDREFKKLY